MNVMVVGGGGREHALIKSLKKSPRVDKLYALPGNDGMEEAITVGIGAKDLDGIVKFALENKIDYAVVAPDDPLVLGLVDRLNEVGIACFGPNKKAAIIEGSKAFSKELMKKYGIPTAEYRIFSDRDEAVSYLDGKSFPIVVKADGLALGKGVIIANTKKEAVAAVDSMMKDLVFGDSGKNVVIEEFLTGPEVSVLAFTDGKTIKPMVSSMDHKRAKDGDEGLNTGGMGAVAPNPYYTEEIAKECMDTIFIPTVRAMEKEGRTFRGCLYFGLMITEKGPKVIEYNCRFGDPETQVVLPLLETDLLEAMLSTTNGTLYKTEIRFGKGAACCVIVASGGYPESYGKGYEINCPVKDGVYFAGVKKEGDKLLTNGGRVLGVTATASTLKEAIDSAYKKVAAVSFKDAYYRKDIGKRAMEIKER